MKILVIPSWYATTTNPTKGSFFREQALMMRNNGVNQVVLAYVQMHKFGESIPQRIEHVEDNGMSVFIRHIHSYGFAKMHLVYVLVLWWYYYKLFRYVALRGFMPDIIHAHSFLPAGIISCLIGRKRNIPVVLTEHSSYVHTKSLSWIESLSLKFAINNSSITTAVSKSLAKVMSEYSNKRIAILPNNLSPLFIYDPKAKKQTPFVFYTACNLIDSKRVLFLLECFKDAFANSKDVILKIAGGGIMRNGLEDYIKRNGMKSKVFLLGRIGRKELAKLAKESNSMVLLSTNETFGVAYIEAIASGCPVIATRNGGAEDIVNARNGLLVDVDNRDQAVNALKYIFHNYSQYNLHEMSKECISRFGEDTLYYQTMEIYKKLCKRLEL